MLIWLLGIFFADVVPYAKKTLEVYHVLFEPSQGDFYNLS